MPFGYLDVFIPLSSLFRIPKISVFIIWKVSNVIFVPIYSNWLFFMPFAGIFLPTPRSVPNFSFQFFNFSIPIKPDLNKWKFLFFRSVKKFDRGFSSSYGGNRISTRTVPFIDGPETPF